MKPILHLRSVANRLNLASMLALVVILPWTSPLSAQDAIASATGTWKWSIQTPNGEFPMTLVLKQEGNKLTGHQIWRNGEEIPIKEGKIENNTVAFHIVRERGDRIMTSKYEGKLDGDFIRGTNETNFGDNVRKRDWIAKREKTEPVNVSGLWTWKFTTPGGQTFEPKLQLKQENNELKALMLWGDRERPVNEAKLDGNKLSLLMKRERDGQTFTTQYNGVVQDDKITGKVESNWGGENRTYDWEATRVKSEAK